MSFTFGFFGSEQSQEESGTGPSKPTASSLTASIDQTVATSNVKQHFPLEMFENGGDIVYIPTTIGMFSYKIAVIPENEDAIDKTSDIIPGVYEGGNKVWECSIDLTTLLREQKYNLPQPDISSVIELGCGHGFPGIAALQLGYKHVVFSDLNAEVVDSVTWPNIFLNCSDDMSRSVCYSGDWDDLSKHLFSR